MADKIQNSYKSSKNIYDVIITHKTWWSKIYRNIVWNGADNNTIAKKLLSKIPDDFSGKILDVPVGTAVFVYEKYNNMKNAVITCLDYSADMLSIAKGRLNGEHIEFLQGDIGNLQFSDSSFDIIFSMNGFHVFPDKDKAFAEVTRVLKKDGILLSSFYVEGKSKLADFISKKILANKGWFSLPFDSEESVKQRLSKNFEIEFFKSDGSLIYFCARKVR